MDELVDQFRNMLSEFHTSHIAPTHSKILELTRENMEIRLEKDRVRDELSHVTHYNQLLLEKIKTQDLEMEALRSVSILKLWEKKVDAKEKEIQEWKEKYERIQKTLQETNKTNFLLNQRLELQNQATDESSTRVKIKIGNQSYLLDPQSNYIYREDGYTKQYFLDPNDDLFYELEQDRHTVSDTIAGEKKKSQYRFIY